MTLKDIIGETLSRRLETASISDLVHMLNAPEVDAPVTRVIKNMTTGEALAGYDKPRQTRKRGRGRNKVAYVRVTKPGRQKDVRVIANELPSGNVRITWQAIVSAKQPISAMELETKTGLSKKAVESAVWALRNAGLVASKPVAQQ